VSDALSPMEMNTVERVIPKDELKKLLQAEMEKGTRVVAPVQLDEGRFYSAVSQVDAIDWDQTGKPPVRSLKEFFFPKTEPLLSYRYHQDGLEVDPPQEPVNTLIVGARPCDVRALLLLDKVFGWDYDDDLYKKRREASTIVTFLCESDDEDCFCEMLGSSRDDTTGSDLFLIPTEKGYIAEAVTDKGTRLMETHGDRFQEQDVSRPQVERKQSPGVEDMDALVGWLGESFDNEAWAQLGIRCLGCGACAHVCPTCHCFDIVDEPDDTATGTRRRNWDSCQVPLFTLHASGHNPRDLQFERYRQRILHKFSYFPERFESVLCTGCGRCSRACPADQNLLGVLEDLWSLAQQSK